MKSKEKIDNFFRISLKYFGKKIGLNSNQYFSIEQINNPDKEQVSEYRYVIKYGFPQSGCVNMYFNYLQKSNAVTVDKISVYAPPVGKNIIMANFAPQIQIGDIDISMNLGVNSGTQEHTSFTDIDANPNALKILDIAILDLSQAQILGECMVDVPEGSNNIPCCDCIHISDTKGKKI